MKILAKNKFAYSDYEIHKDLIAGLVLHGWEVKSIKAGNVALKESYISPYKEEIWIYGMHVNKWKFASPDLKINESRSRKLLIKKSEIRHLMSEVATKNFVIVPIEIGLERGKIKLKIALGKGRKKFDKRAKLKSDDQKRTVDRDLKKMGY